jgi:hypothetical protein
LQEKVKVNNVDIRYLIAVKTVGYEDNRAKYGLCIERLAEQFHNQGTGEGGNKQAPFTNN